MIKLETPIVIHPDVYDGLMIVRGTFDLRAQAITLMFAPVQSSADAVSLGVEEQTEKGTEYLFPEMIRSYTLSQNLQEPDPRIEQLLSAWAAFLENLEAIVVELQDEPDGLASTPYQIGTTKWQLRGSVESLGNRKIGRTVRDLKPKKEKGNPHETMARTADADDTRLLPAPTRA